ncbi:hypothetical protein ACQX8C_14560 [Staphylococcus aureus]|uniref:hypothetical protein n=2 Tax=Bacteria TaxID=2 RepID=UPI0028749CD4|nr:hypothetical protein [Staphylococcus aureus]HDW3906962.1 hypothetical protein [Escherichia coli]
MMDPIDKEVVQDMFEKWAVTEGDRLDYGYVLDTDVEGNYSSVRTLNAFRGFCGALSITTMEKS